MKERDVDETPSDEESQVTAMWRDFLVGNNPMYHRQQRVFRLLPSSPRCKVCYAPFRGFGGYVMRLQGRGPAKMNPNLCGVCEHHAREHPGGAVIPLSMLFADVRGSTSLAEKLGTTRFSALIARFYDAVTRELLRENALINRLVGDEVIALFVPAIAGEKHAVPAIQAARAILKATGHDRSEGPWIPIGIGVHTGEAFVGAVGSGGVSDITALGDDVNLTARLATSALAGEIVLTEAARALAGPATDGLESRRLEVKGRNTPVDAWVMRVGEVSKAS